MNIKYILLSLIIFIVSLVVFYNIFNPFKYTIIEPSVGSRNDNIDKIVNNYKSQELERPVPGDTSVTNYNSLNDTKSSLVVQNVGGNMVDPEKIEKDKCEQLHDTGQCDGLSNSSCGFCLPKDQIMYGGCDLGFTWNEIEKKCIRNGAKLPYRDLDKRNTRPIGNLCNPTNKYPNPTNWIAPTDPRVVEKCRKKKEQKLCKTVTTCGDDSVTKICGWCPVKNVSMVKQPGSTGDYHNIKYDDDKCDWDYKFYGLKGPLITGEVCGEFTKKFPCVGTQKKDGTHTKDCLNFLYKKNTQERFIGNQEGFVSKIIEPYVAPGCEMDIKNNYKKDSRSYQNILKDMNKNVKMAAKKGGDYDQAVKAHYNCYFGEKPDPCDNRFGNLKDLPLECTEKLFNESGCKRNSMLNPKKNFLKDVRTDWKDYINNLKSRFPILNKITAKYKSDIRLGVNEKTQYSNLLSYFKNLDSNENLDEQIFKSQFCNLNEVDVGKKPCWYDFTLFMGSIDSIKVDYLIIDFNNASDDFKDALKLSSHSSSNKVYSKHYAVYDGNYILRKKTYEKKYFPFWNFMELYKKYWKKNWTKFVNILVKHPSVSFNNGALEFQAGSDFDVLVRKLNRNKELEITNSMYLNDPDFPYASFIRIFKRY